MFIRCVRWRHINFALDGAAYKFKVRTKLRVYYRPDTESKVL
jgi:hypothetical protein